MVRCEKYEIWFVIPRSFHSNVCSLDGLVPGQATTAFYSKHFNLVHYGNFSRVFLILIPA